MRDARLAFFDRLTGARKLQNAHVAEPRRNHDVSRVAGEPASCYPVLKDVDRAGYRAKHAWRLDGRRVAREQRTGILLRLLLEIAEDAFGFHFLRCLGLRRLRRLSVAFTDDIRIEVHADHEFCA